MARTINQLLLEHYKSTIDIQLRASCQTDAEKAKYLDAEIRKLLKVIDKNPKDDLGISLRPSLYKRLAYVRKRRNAIAPVYRQDTLFRA